MVSNNSRTQWLQIVCARNYSYRTIGHTVRFHTMHDHMEPYDTLYTTMRHNGWYRMTHCRTEPYDTERESYATVQRIVCYRMTHHMHHTARRTVPYDGASYGTVRRVVRHRTSRRTLPYDAPYGPSYGSVRSCVVRYRTTRRTASY